MTRLILLIGLPGSGKSYLAQHLITECPQCCLVSTDEIRAKLFGEAAIQGPWQEIWREIQQQFQQAVIQKSPAVVYDATNANYHHRQDVIVLGQEIGFHDITALWLDVPLELCLERNQKRSRQVPLEIILRMQRQLQEVPPSCEEGFHQLIQLN